MKSDVISAIAFESLTNFKVCVAYRPRGKIVTGEKLSLLLISVKCIKMYHICLQIYKVTEHTS